MNKIEFLKNYNRNISILASEDISNKEIPKSWYEIFTKKEISGRIKVIIELWKKYCGAELSSTIDYLEKNLVDVELIEINGDISILYSIKRESGEVGYYQGGNPEAKFNNSELEKVWDVLPESIKIFYKKLHNGFYYYASQSMGLDRIEEVTFFDDYEWGIIEDLEDPIKINLKTTYGFFSNGAGGYVAIDCGNNNSATIWFTNDEPEYNVEFWDVVDEWIVIGFQD